MTHHRLAVAAIGAVVLALSWTASATGQAPEPETQPATTVAPAPQDPGFDLVVVGTIPGVEPEQFSQAVAEALPDRLVDPAVNFTAHPAYQAERDYRLVMVFHGEHELDAPALCRRQDDVAAEPPAGPEELMQATRVTGAFCEGDGVLSTATDRMLGAIEPGQAGFRFLVGDVAKQLFPDGFDSIPGTQTPLPTGTAPP